MRKYTDEARRRVMGDNEGNSLAHLEEPELLKYSKVANALIVFVCKYRRYLQTNRRAGTELAHLLTSPEMACPYLQDGFPSFLQCRFQCSQISEQFASLFEVLLFVSFPHPRFLQESVNGEKKKRIYRSKKEKKRAMSG
ncbi:MAG: uncharacterized protein A8A55_1973 [Amphiamblys sp. WSBS2006]|nr:MAG: uncharacterized protein A8A55_1973 [Amphiamblys sp. WSBS2006]